MEAIMSSQSATRPMSALAIASLVAGLLGVVLIAVPLASLILGGVALVLGIFAFRIANRGEASGRGVAIAGIVLGAVALAVGLLIVSTSVTSFG
jgi:Domain of unknown function (DUF4190)